MGVYDDGSDFFIEGERDRKREEEREKERKKEKERGREGEKERLGYLDMNNR